MARRTAVGDATEGAVQLGCVEGSRKEQERSCGSRAKVDALSAHDCGIRRQREHWLVQAPCHVELVPLTQVLQRVAPLHDAILYHLRGLRPV